MEYLSEIFFCTIQNYVYIRENHYQHKLTCVGDYIREEKGEREKEQRETGMIPV